MVTVSPEIYYASDIAQQQETRRRELNQVDCRVVCAWLFVAGLLFCTGIGLATYQYAFLPDEYLDTIRGYSIILQDVRCVDSTHTLPVQHIPFTRMSERTQPFPSNESSDIANMAFGGDTYFGIVVTYNSTESILPPPPTSPIASSPITSPLSSGISGMSDASYHTVMYSVRFPNMEDCVERATKLVKTYTWNERFTYLFIQHNVNPYPFAYAKTELTYILTPIWVVLYFVPLIMVNVIRVGGPPHNPAS